MGLIPLVVGGYGYPTKKVGYRIDKGRGGQEKGHNPPRGRGVRIALPSENYI